MSSKKKKKKLNKYEEYYDECDGDFAYIAGYTPGGVPYGVKWEEVGIDPYLPFEEKVKRYLDSFNNHSENNEADDLPF